MFIRQFMELRSKILMRLRELREAKQENTQEYSQLVLMITRINQMRDYIVHGDWARKTTRDKYVFWINCGYNYLLTANKYKTSEQCIKVLVSRADVTLSKILSHPFQLIGEGNVIDGWIEFGININRLDINELFGRPILMIIPKPADLDMCYALDDCKEEIKFFRAHNTYKLRKQLKDLNPQKMSYLISLGALNDAAFTEERKKLIKAVLRLNNTKPPKR